MANPETLEVFRTLEISASADAIARLGEEIERVLPSPVWMRDREREKEMKRIGAAPNTFVFLRQEDASDPAASLSLVTKDGQASVGNIVPPKTGQLSRGQYNAILEDFISVGVRPLEKKLGLNVIATAGARPLSDWLSPEAVKKLKVFSGAANKSSGASHPADYRRWQDFIIQAHKDQSEFDASLLRRWLKEIENWPIDAANDLASDYDFGRDLLRRFSAMDTE